MLALEPTPEQMFDPKAYAGLYKPVTQGSTLPPWCYTSEEYYKAEVKHLFMKVWNFLGRADRIPNPGDFFTVTYVGVPLLIVRGKDMRVRAFANTCRHRGAQVEAKDHGNCRAFKCEYHGWVYDLDGSLRGAAGMEKTENFDRGKYGLVPVRLETWGGFIFINFDRDADDLTTYLGDLPTTMAAYDCENLRVARIVTHEVNCNWKTHIENAMEDYHVATVHGTTLSKLQVEHWNVATKGAWFNMRERHKKGTRALLEEDRQHELPRIKTLTGHADEGTNFVCLNPSTMLGMTCDTVWYIELQPQGPHKTRVQVGSCFPKETIERPDFQDKVKYYYKRWDKSIGEDNIIAEVQHRGLLSPFAQPGRMSHLEPLIPQLGAWWVDHVMRGVTADKRKKAAPAATARRAAPAPRSQAKSKAKSGAKAKAKRR